MIVAAGFACCACRIYEHESALVGMRALEAAKGDDLVTGGNLRPCM